MVQSQIERFKQQMEIATQRFASGQCYGTTLCIVFTGSVSESDNLLRLILADHLAFARQGKLFVAADKILGEAQDDFGKYCCDNAFETANYARLPETSKTNKKLKVRWGNGEAKHEETPCYLVLKKRPYWSTNTI